MIRPNFLAVLLEAEWMRVVLWQPSDHCYPDVVPASREGWVRW